MTPADWGLFLYCTMLFLFTWWEINQLLQAGIDNAEEENLTGNADWDNHFHVQRIDPAPSKEETQNHKIEVDSEGVIEKVQTPDGELYSIVVVPADKWTKEVRDMMDCKLYKEDEADDGECD